MLLRTLALLAGALVLAPLAICAHASVVPLAFYADESLTIVSRDVPVSGTVAEAAAQALVNGPTGGFPLESIPWMISEGLHVARTETFDGDECIVLEVSVPSLIKKKDGSTST